MFRTATGTIASFFLIALLLLSLSACKKRKLEKQKKSDDRIIKEYIASHNLNATATGTGLYYVITSQGTTGTYPVSTSNVTVNYKGYFTDGKVFDQSPPAGVTFSLQSVIKGWQEGIPFFRKGGKGILLIPSALGYGDKASSKVPANSVLIFDVELLDVQ